MKRKMIAIILTLFIAMISTLPVFADTLSEPEKYQITVTSTGGTYDFNGIEVTFKKGFLGKSMEPVTFDVLIYAENGAPYIEFSPSVPDFEKKVAIKVQNGERDFFDVVTGETCSIYLTRYNFKAKHFSRLVVID